MQQPLTMSEFNFSALDYVTGRDILAPAPLETSSASETSEPSDLNSEFALKPNKFYDTHDYYAGRRAPAQPGQFYNRVEAGVYPNSNYSQPQGPAGGPGFDSNEFSSQSRAPTFNGLERSGDSMIPQHLRNKIMMSSAMNQQGKQLAEHRSPLIFCCMVCYT